MQGKQCSATKLRVDNDPGSVTFPCPKCSREIVRSTNARVNAIKYTCACGFTGPN